jgi:hypothetical protein
MPPRAFLASAIVLLAMSSPACGGEGGPRAKKTDGLGPADASAVDQCQVLSALQFQPINNGFFWDGINPAATAWYVNYDGEDESVDGSVPPYTDASDAPNGHPRPEKIPWRCANFPSGDRAATDYALNLQVSNLKPPIDQPPLAYLDGAPPPKAGWGCLIGSNLGGYDATAWDGISFWIRQDAPEGSVGTTFISVSENHTDSNHSDPITGLRPCEQDAAPNGDTTQQCDSFGTGVAVYTTWKFYALPFAKMRQRGYGKAVPQSVFLEEGLLQLLGVKFDFNPTQNWSIWLDDIAYYKELPDAG